MGWGVRSSCPGGGVRSSWQGGVRSSWQGGSQVQRGGGVSAKIGHRMSTLYTASGMPLAFTQEDFLV